MDAINTPINSIDALCASLHMSLNRLGEVSGIPVMTLQKLRKNGNVSISTLEQLAERVGIKPDDIMYGVISNLMSAGKNLPIMSEEDMRASRIERQKRMFEHGYLGEAYVAEQERHKLIGTPYADSVSTDYAINGQPFDVLSFDATSGEPIMIEVKSTCFGPHRKFMMSENELRFMRECVANGRRYELHRVYYVTDPARRGLNIYTPSQLFSLFDIEPYNYALKPKWQNGKT